MQIFSNTAMPLFLGHACFIKLSRGLFLLRECMCVCVFMGVRRSFPSILPSCTWISHAPTPNYLTLKTAFIYWAVK